MTQELAAHPTRWQRAAGLELLGLVSGTGLNRSSYLVRRADGQVVQLTELLHWILNEAERPLPPTELAQRVSNSYGRELDVDGLTLLAESKLEPLGLLKHPGTDVSAPAPTAAPLLALSAKTTIVPRRAVERLSGLLKILFWPPVVIAGCLALVALDIQLFVVADAATALTAVLMTPQMMLALVVLMTVGALVHEVGHATACRYGGATPGVIGVGLYLVFPAFYTDVTDSYRLDRAGRLRTDLGGLYFHLWWVLSAGAGYLLTGSPLLLLLVIVTQLQMVQQLPPAVRLDGYFVLADLAGVPDLFSRVVPVLKSLVPGRSPDPRVLELRPVSRWIVTSWVLIIIPFLGFVLAWVAISLPFIISQAIGAAAIHAQTLAVAVALAQPLEATMALLGILLLAMPTVGAVLVLSKVALSIGQWAVGRLRVRPPRPLPRHAVPSRRLRIGRHS
ncbi:hypothetical protein [Sinomonas sp. B1-1]|uniref:hypothetical protein n=1 Tax=Sinomonas sp. B1-1 TaxID=3141454 RepID=UPI003D2A72C5